MNLHTTNYLLEHREEAAADVAAALAADPRFAQMVDRNALRHVFATNGTLLTRLKDLAANQAVDLNLRGAVERVLNTAIWDTGVLDLSQASFAAEFRGGVAALVAAEQITEGEGDTFLALGGGYLLDRLTAAEVETAWAALDAAAAVADLRQRCAAAYNAVVAALDAGETDTAALATLFATGLDS